MEQKNFYSHIPYSHNVPYCFFGMISVHFGLSPLNAILLNVAFNFCYAKCLNAECRYAECRYAECRYAECRYAECRYAECLYADSRGAINQTG
jgi:hypothetical protein